LRDGEFAQVTKDDTYVQMLVDEGRISLEEANSHPQRSLLTRALDGRDADPEYSVRQVKTSDRYLLCSDGLSGVVSADTIESTLREYVDPNQCAARLIELALRGGGPDNITVIIADVTDENIVEDQPIVGGAAASDRGMATSANESMSSARGAALSAPRPPAPESDEGGSGGGRGRDEDPDRAKRHPVRTALLLVVLLAILGGGLWYSWSVTQSRFYVGATDDGTVAIFKGVPGKIAWLDLSKVYEKSGLRLDDLTPSAQDTVRQGIEANNAEEARRKLAELTDPNNPSRKQRCPNASASASAGATATTTASPPASGTASLGTPGVTVNPSGPAGVPMSPSPAPAASC
jgi:protein phosphatase